MSKMRETSLFALIKSTVIRMLLVRDYYYQHKQKKPKDLESNMVY